MNQITMITIYNHQGAWVFDDDRVGLVKEPFVCGIPTMIQAILTKNGMPRAKRFNCYFSFDAFPGAETLTWVRPEFNGNVYTWNGLEGWLCPALFKYVDHTPKKIYVKVEPCTKA